MIFDSINHIGLYSTIPQFKKIEEFVNSHNIFELNEGRYNIDKDLLYASVQIYQTTPSLEQSTRQFEIHNHHDDVQIILEGVEIMKFATQADLIEELPCSIEGDFHFYSVKSESVGSIVVRKGQFVHFPSLMPHMPSLAHGQQSSVKKIVFKIRSH